MENAWQQSRNLISNTYRNLIITESENGFMEPKCPMRFNFGDGWHPKVISWEYDDWFLGNITFNEKASLLLMVQKSQTTTWDVLN